MSKVYISVSTVLTGQTHVSGLIGVQVESFPPKVVCHSPKNCTRVMDTQAAMDFLQLVFCIPLRF
jgi:hypothetical protein